MKGGNNGQARETRHVFARFDDITLGEQLATVHHVFFRARRFLPTFCFGFYKI